ncbi:hypothetical protein ACIHAA_04545 [Streptomyces sp. NPDC052040]|uniref:hypothetical protein n=1 Tax=Streptomyces sp. NPDC052040 TaxID=3365682 RepID=UPI0037CFC3D2
MRWRAQPRWARWVAAVYVIGFLEGAGSHAYDVLTGGLHAYGNWPLPSQLLFHALLVLDLVAAVWVVLAWPTGPALCSTVMAADLTANWWTNWTAVTRDPLAYLQPVGLTPITLFGLFVFVTATPLARSFRLIDRSSNSPRPVSGRYPA